MKLFKLEGHDTYVLKIRLEHTIHSDATQHNCIGVVGFFYYTHDKYTFNINKKFKIRFYTGVLHLEPGVYTTQQIEN